MQKRLLSIKSEKTALEASLGQKQALMATTQKELGDLEAKKDRLSKQVNAFSSVIQWNLINVNYRGLH